MFQITEHELGIPTRQRQLSSTICFRGVPSVPWVHALAAVRIFTFFVQLPTCKRVPVQHVFCCTADGRHFDVRLLFRLVQSSPRLSAARRRRVAAVATSHTSHVHCFYPPRSNRWRGECSSSTSPWGFGNLTGSGGGFGDFGASSGESASDPDGCRNNTADGEVELLELLELSSSLLLLLLLLLLTVGFTGGSGSTVDGFGFTRFFCPWSLFSTCNCLSALVF